MITSHSRFVFTIVLALTAALSAPALANAQQPRLKSPPKSAREGSSLAAATQSNPGLVRNHLLAIHGFTRARLDSASTDVPAVLRGFIDDPGESMTVRRQAIKALRLYPSGENFDFIDARLGAAPVVLQRLYISSLAGFIDSRGAQVAELLAGKVSDPDATIRHAAVGVAGALRANQLLRAALERQLADENDQPLKEAIRRVLAAR